MFKKKYCFLLSCLKDNLLKKIFFICFFITLSSNGQITKGNWMMGGTGRLGYGKSIHDGISSEGSGCGISPNVGYFFVDKFAIGTSAQLSYNFKRGDTRSISSQSVSPFVRYYFLDQEKQVNVFSEARYGFGWMRHNDYKFDKYLIKAGTVFFLNSCVGVEVALNYSNEKMNSRYESRSLYVDIGFQIHLERQK